METLKYFISYSKENNLCLSRDIKSLESEWYIHNICYNLGMSKESLKDVDLDFIEDDRWYVKFAVDVEEVFYNVRAKQKKSMPTIVSKNINRTENN